VFHGLMICTLDSDQCQNHGNRGNGCLSKLCSYMQFFVGISGMCHSLVNSHDLSLLCLQQFRLHHFLPRVPRVPRAYDYCSAKRYILPKKSTRTVQENSCLFIYLSAKIKLSRYFIILIES